MRLVLMGDAIAAARVLLACQEADWPGCIARMLKHATLADRYRRRFGRAHPLWGDGSLMAVAGTQLRAREPFLTDQRYLRALQCVISEISSFLLSLTPAPYMLDDEKSPEVFAMAETKPKMAAVDPVWQRIGEEAVEAIREEPLLGGLIHSSLLHHPSMERALAYRFSLKLASGEMSEQILREIADEAYSLDPVLGQAARADLVAVYDRDPACHRFLQPILFFKGYQAVQAYRVGHWLWQRGRIDLAYFVQMRVSEVFGVDIHPAARVGRGIMIDHAHSIVIGETAVVGDNVSMLHSVTLGGTGKEDGDRHPKIENGVMIGAGAKVLGNIRVGHCSRIAAGSVVLQDVPPCSTVAGVPARVVGEAGCAQPSVTMDQLIHEQLQS
jgi:serine O-acetyltransferase